MIGNVSKEFTLQQIGVHHKLFPEWILPDSRIADTDATQDDGSLLRNKLRPDIMLVELTREEQATYRNGNSQHSEGRVLSTSIGDKHRKYEYWKEDTAQTPTMRGSTLKSNTKCCTTMSC